ncbi:MAG: class I SAM-dependent methyltransferase [Gammaproteobacteria bacterium]|nr:class I SAM-dependent methyltransferase [Gammaproteobacteria bacterium]
MADHAVRIKSMKLYSHIDRVHNELAELGKAGDAPLAAADLAAFDQLHYHGTDAVDAGVALVGIDRDTRVLEIGAGLGGPARHVADNTGAQVTALELQADHHRLAAELTERCGLAGHVTHVRGDFLSHDWRGRRFDVIVSWLALYHIPDRPRLLRIARDLLADGGAFYAEDLFSRRPFDANQWAQVTSGLYANHLPDWAAYRAEVEDAGFSLVQVNDMSDDWTHFTGERLAAYRAARARHIRVHGAPTYRAMEDFYSLVNGYFRSGKLGGIRWLARRV